MHNCFVISQERLRPDIILISAFFLVKEKSNLHLAEEQKKITT